MIKKKENSAEELSSGMDKINNIFKNATSFFFYFSYDPDAIGASISLALYIKKNFHKECFIFIPKGTEYSNVDFLFKISAYNEINVINEPEMIYNIIEQKTPAFIICDTPNHHLLPDYENIIKRKKIESPVVEIDHHFGGDSEQIFQDSITLYKLSNSSCEIIAELIERFEKKENDNLWMDRGFSRNIIISLLVGIIFDTQNGKFIYDEQSFKHWYDFLSARLKWLTWGNPNNIRTTNDILMTLNNLTKKEKQIISELVKQIKVINCTGMLYLETTRENPLFNYDSFRTSTLLKIIADLVNRVPEQSEAVGIIAYFDKMVDLFFIKIRRAVKYKKYDVRNAEDLIKEIFKENLIGGGGHEGATSFRISKIDKNDFKDKIKILHEKLSEIISL